MPVMKEPLVFRIMVANNMLSRWFLFRDGTWRWVHNCGFCPLDPRPHCLPYEKWSGSKGA